MEGYRILQVPGGWTFRCDKCTYEVALAQLGKGANAPRLRTLGAAEMNKHIQNQHPKRSFDEAYGIK